eukprot:jgi/Ulvmu1/7412/UM036_0072.1
MSLPLAATCISSLAACAAMLLLRRLDRCRRVIYTNDVQVLAQVGQGFVEPWQQEASGMSDRERRLLLRAAATAGDINTVSGLLARRQHSRAMSADIARLLPDIVHLCKTAAEPKQQEQLAKVLCLLLCHRYCAARRHHAVQATAHSALCCAAEPVIMTMPCQRCMMEHDGSHGLYGHHREDHGDAVQALQPPAVAEEASHEQLPEALARAGHSSAAETASL